jgi:hypothetical protein
VKTISIVLLLVLPLIVACGGNSTALPSADDSARRAAADQGRSSAATYLDAGVEAKLVVTSSVAFETQEIRSTYLGIGQLVRGFGGHVADATISDRDGASASLRLRVPATRHDEMLSSLRNYDGAKVIGESTNAREITEEYTDLGSRLYNLQRSEAEYLALLQRAGSVSEVLQVTAKIDEVRGEIERVKGRINLLANLSDFATVNVALSAPASAASIASPVRVLIEATEVSVLAARIILNVAIVLLVAAGWLVPVALAGVMLWRIFGRRIKVIYERVLSW